MFHQNLHWKFYVTDFAPIIKWGTIYYKQSKKECKSASWTSAHTIFILMTLGFSDTKPYLIIEVQGREALSIKVSVTSLMDDSHSVIIKLENWKQLMPRKNDPNSKASTLPRHLTFEGEVSPFTDLVRESCHICQHYNFTRDSEIWIANYFGFRSKNVFGNYQV